MFAKVSIHPVANGQQVFTVKTFHTVHLVMTTLTLMENAIRLHHVNQSVAILLAVLNQATPVEDITKLNVLVS